MRKQYIKYILILISLSSFAQEQPFWGLMQINGSLSLNGQYNDSYYSSGSLNKYFQYGAGASLSTESFIWHPNFLTLSVSGNYRQQLGETVSTIMPDYFSDYSNRDFNLRARFFSSLPYKLNTYMNYSFLKGEDRFFDSDIENTKWGGDLSYSGKYKLESSFESSKNSRYDNLTKRDLQNEITFYKGSVNKSFSTFDSNDFMFNFQTIRSKQTNLFDNTNNIMSLVYNNNLKLNKIQGLNLSSNVFWNKSKGSGNYMSLGFNESFGIPITKYLNFTGVYGQRQSERETNTLKEVRTKGILSHRLYSSLNNSISINRSTLNHIGSFNTENTVKTFRSIYRKKIPFVKGNLSLNYSYSNIIQARNSKNQFASVFDEVYTLNDGLIIVLKSPNIQLGSILVTDSSGTIFYEEDIDYILISRNKTVEIQRLVGGGIANGENVFIDYDTRSNTSYNYNANESDFGVRLDVLDQLLTVYYDNSYRHFLSVEGDSEGQGLNEFDRYKYGFLFKYKIFTLESYYEDNQSSLYSHKSYNYNISAVGSISRKLNFKFNGTINDYSLYFKEGDTNRSTIISSDINYSVNSYTKLTFNLSYSEQVGDIQNFTMLSGRTELTKRLNQLYISLGINYYNRDVPSNEFKQQYIGTRIKLIRNF